MGAEPVDFFISYTSSDIAWGRWVDRLLRDRGCTTVLQVYDFAAGESFVERIHAEAEALVRRALAIDEKALGPHHPGVAIDL